MVYYFIIGLSAFVLMFAFGIGLDKVVKLLIGNYISIVFVLAVSLMIEIFIVHLDHSFFEFFQNTEQIEFFLTNNKVLILILIYLLLLVVIFAKSSISIELGESKFSKVLYNFILAPLTVLSILATLGVAIMGVEIFTLDGIYFILEHFEVSGLMYRVVMSLPVAFILPGISLIVFSLGLPSFLKFKSSSSSKTSKAPVDGELGTESTDGS